MLSWLATVISARTMEYCRGRLTLAPAVVVALAGIFAPVMSLAAESGMPLSSVRTIDGTENNNGGATNVQLMRMAPVDYPGTGSGQTIHEEPDVPNARDISNRIARQITTRPNDRNLSDFIWVWGQFLDHDISLSINGPDFGFTYILVHDPNDLLAPGPLPMARSRYALDTGTIQNPRAQMNNITAFIDASNVYGSDQVRADILRTLEGGQLRTSPGNLLPFNIWGQPNDGGPDPGLFLAGDIRANEQVGLTAMHTLFVREHNRLAVQLAKMYPQASDEEIYQMTRKIVGAQMQVITYREFLPALLGPYAPNLQADYDPNVLPTITNEFSTAAFRFAHSTLPSAFRLASDHGPVGSISLMDAFFNPDFLANDPGNIDLLLRGFALQPAQEIDNQLVEEVRTFLFGPPGAGGLDLAALNIQRGRDHGIPPYNDIRVAYGLEAVSDFSDITSDTGLQQALFELYGSVDEIDAWVGALAEDHLDGASVGELVAAVLYYQFSVLRDGDHYFWLNDPDLWTDSIRKLAALESLTLADVIMRNTRIRNLPRNVFFVECPGIFNCARHRSVK